MGNGGMVLHTSGFLRFCFSSICLFCYKFICVSERCKAAGWVGLGLETKRPRLIYLGCVGDCYGLASSLSGTEQDLKGKPCFQLNFPTTHIHRQVCGLDR